MTSGTYFQTFDMLDAASYNAAFIAAHGGTAASAGADLLAGMVAGEAYVNIHTAAPTGFPPGKIRGFLQVVPEPGTVALLGIALGGVYISTRRRRESAGSLQR